MKSDLYDAIVVGGGAAGMFAAATAAQRGVRVLLLEKNDRCGKKLSITGKGRCNVTNNCSADEVLKQILRNPRFLYSAVNACPPTTVMAFFEEHGCPLKTERGNRVFPVSDRSADVITALERAMRTHGVQRHRATVTGLTRTEGGISGVTTADGAFSAPCVLLCTGGVSYPATGSTGDGYRLAESVGHTISSPMGSLVPLVSPDADCAALQGLSLRNTAIRLINEQGKTIYRDFGEMLFTHFGLSGPMALSASAHLTQGEQYCVLLDLKPALEEGALDARMQRDFLKYANRSMENAVADLYPASLIPVILRKADILPQLRANSLTKQQRRALLEQTKAFSLTINGTRPISEAIITRGGVRVRELDPKTMQSRLVHGLYFAGELIDCDAYTGGFNLQIAWSTAYTAAAAIAEGESI